MTLIVGIRCNDGVVLAASGPGTMPSEDGLPPARQWERKLRVIGGQAVLGVTGHDGLAQEMALSLERCLAEPDRRDAAEDVLRTRIREALAAPVQRSVAIHRTLQGLPGFGITTNEYVLSQSLLTVPFESSLRLYLLDPECSLTEISDELSCAAVGSGRGIAEPLLSLLQTVLWQDGTPDLMQAEMTAYWAVRHAIDHSRSGLSHPIQLVTTARGTDGSVEIVERGEREMAAIGQAIDSRLEEIKRGFGAHPPHPPGTSQPGPKGPPPGTEKPVKKRVPEVRLTLESPERRGRFFKW